ncbi:MAG: TadE family protein [Endomicrobiia bacterium]|nr:pilus assembly protein [Endomicrobiaceae bacterium]MDD3053404.1 pilus assembly protein [Endomicrobiaceae bacterium]MDD3922414.1 pilus assembly protein [Endomicrobiaceae bacterium]MDD5102688.1 pilus assembly protein [Endomicrobiaceae bacterium]
MLKNRKGNAFVEALFILPMMVLMFVSVIWFARVLLTWQQLISATRYGTDMIATTTLNAYDIKKDIENYLTHRMIDGRRLDAEKIKEINVDINDYPKIDINVRDLTKIFNDINGLIKGLLIPNADVSSVKITYCYDLPNIMHFVGLKEINITAKSSVLSGSGCKNNIHNRSSK